MGQTGEPRPGLLADRKVFDRRKGTVKDAEWGSADSLLTPKVGGVSLVLAVRRPEVIMELRPAEPHEMPSAARTLVALADRWERRSDAWVREVRPTSARGVPGTTTRRIVTVRVWHTEFVNGRRTPIVITREWLLWLDRSDVSPTSGQSARRWETGRTIVWRPWRRGSVPTPVSSAGANEQLKSGGMSVEQVKEFDRARAETAAAKRKAKKGVEE